MRFSVLGSGSQGNCVFVESGSTAILIDAGFSGKEIASRLARINRTIETISAIFVTHEHHDHISGVGVMSRRCGIPVFANEGTFQGAEKQCKKLFRRCEFETGDAVEWGNVRVRSYAVSHDTKDPVGFIIDDGSCSLGFCTDTGIASRLISRRLGGCDSLVLEFNHDPELLKNGPYPQSLKQRVRSNQGHLSNGDAAKLLTEVLHANLQRVVLAHLSETNNLPELAYRAASGVFDAGQETTRLEISSQKRPTDLFDVS